MLLPSPNMAQAGFISTIMGAAAIFSFYCTSGGKKD